MLIYHPVGPARKHVLAIAAEYAKPANSQEPALFQLGLRRVRRDIQDPRPSWDDGPVSANMLFVALALAGHVRGVE